MDSYRSIGIMFAAIFFWLSDPSIFSWFSHNLLMILSWFPLPLLPSSPQNFIPLPFAFLQLLPPPIPPCFLTSASASTRARTWASTGFWAKLWVAFSTTVVIGLAFIIRICICSQRFVTPLSSDPSTHWCSHNALMIFSYFSHNVSHVCLYFLHPVLLQLPLSLSIASFPSSGSSSASPSRPSLTLSSSLLRTFS